jgi:hypothetical protein
VNEHDVQQALATYLSQEVEAERVNGRIACSLPLTYPDGDSVVVFLAERNGAVEISDYGEAVRMGETVRPRALIPVAQQIARSFGVTFADGRVSALSRAGSDPDVIWRVGAASAQIAHAGSSTQRLQRPHEQAFVEEVEKVLRERKTVVERGQRLKGASGHAYRATLFLPESKTVVEPISVEGRWNAAAAVYVEFGDLGKSNGYRPVAVLDDREREPEEEVVSLILQVGELTQWSRRQEWLQSLTRPH